MEEVGVVTGGPTTSLSLSLPPSLPPSLSLSLSLPPLSLTLSPGSSEMAMANAVQKLADKTPGKEARAMEGFARALRQVRSALSHSLPPPLPPSPFLSHPLPSSPTLSLPLSPSLSLSLSPSFPPFSQLPTIIADNAGYDSSQLVSELRALHSDDKTTMGLGQPGTLLVLGPLLTAVFLYHHPLSLLPLISSRSLSLPPSRPPSSRHGEGVCGRHGLSGYH